MRFPTFRKWLVFVVLLAAVAAALLAPRFWELFVLESRRTTLYDDGRVLYHSVYHVFRSGEHAGQYHGPYRQWHANGVLRKSGRFRHGQRAGVWTRWDTKGQVRYQDRYQNGLWVERLRLPPWWNGQRDRPLRR